MDIVKGKKYSGVVNIRGFYPLKVKGKSLEGESYEFTAGDTIWNDARYADGTETQMFCDHEDFEVINLEWIASGELSNVAVLT